MLVQCVQSQDYYDGGLQARLNWLVDWTGRPTLIFEWIRLLVLSVLVLTPSSSSASSHSVLPLSRYLSKSANILTCRLVLIMPVDSLHCLFADALPATTHSAVDNTNQYVTGHLHIYP